MRKAADILNWSNLHKAYLYFQKNGLKNTWYAAAERIHDKNNNSYTIEALSGAQIEKQQKQAEKLKQESSVCFSILVPAYETKRKYLQELLRSLAEQTYPYWELVLADASAADGVRKGVEGFLQENPQYRQQVRYLKLQENLGISDNSNQALAKLTGSYTGLLDHDDTLSRDALYEMAEAVRRRKAAGSQAVMLYSDEDKMNEDGTDYYDPHRKPEFNLDLILSNNYICHFMVMQTEVLQELKFDARYDGAQDYDLALRCMEWVEKQKKQGAACEIVHVDRILYHWRCHQGSTADNPASKMYAYEAGRKAVSDFCGRRGWKVFLHHERHLGFYRMEYEKDIFQQRGELGAVGGRILCRGRIYAGALQEDGTILYEGLNRHFSGYLHRAVLKQDVFAVDVRCMRLRTECRPFLLQALQESLGGGHTLVKEAGAWMDKPAPAMGTEQDPWSRRILEAWKTGLVKEEQIAAVNLAFGRYLREAGYLILWDPAMELDLG